MTVPAVAQTKSTQNVPEQKEPAQRKPLTTAEVTTATTARSQDVPQLDDEVIVLSPFTVTGEDDDGYLATSTLAGTRLRTELRDVGSALTVITPQFLEDTGARNALDLLVYTPSTEIGGVGGNFSGAQDATGTAFAGVLSERGLLLAPNTNNRIRGLMAADQTRDLFLTSIPFDTYNTDRVQIQRGPNSILFGLSSPGGLIDNSLKQAGYANHRSLENRVGAYGSFRTSVDLNQVILKKELAVRLDVLDDQTKYRQEPTFNRDRRVYGALRYDPKFLSKGSAHTTLRVNYEHGEIVANRPRSLPPADRITPWFETGTTTTPAGKVYNNMNQAVINFAYASTYFPSVPNSGYGSTTSPNYIPGVVGLTPGNLAFFPDSSGRQVGSYYVPNTTFTRQFGLSRTGAIDGTITGLATGGPSFVGSRTEIATRLGLPFASAYKAMSITDPTIFDFYDQLIDGPNKRESTGFNAVNAVLSQTFLRNRIGVQVAVDHQKYRATNEAVFWGLGTGDAAITVDINAVLPDGTPNPNVGRPVIMQRSNYGGNNGLTMRDDIHVMGFVDVRADDFMKKSWLTRLLGRHLFTGVGDHLENNTSAQSFGSYNLAVVDNPLISNIFPQRRELLMSAYLGPDMRGRSSASGLNLSRLSSFLAPTATTLRAFDSHWNKPTSPSAPGYVNPAALWVNPFNNTNSTQSENPANYVGWTDIPVRTLNSYTSAEDRILSTWAASKARNKYSSKSFVWQGYFWDNNIVGTFGYRKDTARAWTVTGPLDPALQTINFSDPAFEFTSAPTSTVSGNTKSYSVVVHTPEFIARKLPHGLDVSMFYNQSSNFQPVAGRMDILGGPIAPPTGKTKDYGIVISAFDKRLTLKVNKYENAATLATGSLGGAGQILPGIEINSWIMAKRYQAGLSGDPIYAGEEYNYGTSVGGVFTQTAAERAKQTADVKAVLDNFDPRILDVFNISHTEADWLPGATQTPITGLPGFAATADTVSKGYEIELYVRPTANWNITVNASKTEAVRSNLVSGTTGEWIAARNQVWNGAAGEMRRSPLNETDTFASYWNAAFYNNYTLQKMLEGSLAPEIRPWRFNVVTSYRFTEGKLKGSMVGGSYRWQDKVMIGFPSIQTTINNTVYNSYDINNPFYGPTDDSVDFWCGYTRKLKGKVTWNIQLNVRNVLGEAGLIPINAQPDGGPAAFRIMDGPTWSITNRFSF